MLLLRPEGVRYNESWLCLLRVLIGSLCCMCICFLWLAIALVLVLVLVLQHSIEHHSNKNNFIQFSVWLDVLNGSFFRESNLQQCVKTVYGESATTGGLPQLSPQVMMFLQSTMLQQRLQVACTNLPQHFLNFSTLWCGAYSSAALNRGRCSFK